MYLTDDMISLGLLKDKMNYNDLLIPTSWAFVEVDDSIKDILSSLPNGINNSLCRLTRRIIDDYTKYNNYLIGAMNKYISDEITEKDVDVLRYIYCYNDNQGINNREYLDNIVNIDKLTYVLVMLMLLFADREDCESLSRVYDISLKELTSIYNISIYGLKDIKEKQNIIGSIWNCIIDLFNRTYINNDLLKGGE